MTGDSTTTNRQAIRVTHPKPQQDFVPKDQENQKRRIWQTTRDPRNGVQRNALAKHGHRVVAVIAESRSDGSCRSFLALLFVVHSSRRNDGCSHGRPYKTNSLCLPYVCVCVCVCICVAFEPVASVACAARRYILGQRASVICAGCVKRVLASASRSPLLLGIVQRACSITRSLLPLCR